jgi:UDP-2,4-diacetamido-2,4,6-trideoxy-beta-L-altropyranose hydrolase
MRMIHMVSLRRATQKDSKAIWQWRNDPETRKNSVNTKPVPWAGHEKWFAQKSCDPRAEMLIVTDGSRKVGFLRLDLRGKTAELSINLAPSERGKGYGTKVIRAAAARGKKSGLRALTAEVKPANKASIKAFEAAGFRRAGLRTAKKTRLAVYKLTLA